MSDCTVLDGKSTLRILASSWAIVVAAKGESDEPEYVIAFAEQAKDFYDDIDDEAACGGSQLAADAAGLSFEATVLATPFAMHPRSDPEEDQYDQVADTGNELLSSAGVDDAKFISADCHGKVNDTDECLALT